MKFFTKDLYRRCQSRDDDILDAASAEWERANESYERHLREIEPSLPAHLCEFVNLLLHDAKVLSISRKEGRLFLVLQKDIPPDDVVFLDYELEGEPVAEPFRESPGDWSEPTDFQFDEFEILDPGRHFAQSIVFGNGWAMHLRFRDVRVSLARPLALGAGAA